MGGLLNRLIKSEVYDKSPNQILQEEQMQEMAFGTELPPMSGYTGGQPPSMPVQAPLPPNLEHETMKIYLQPKTPKNKGELKGSERFWIYDDEVTTAIITGNYTKVDTEKFKTIMRQARYLQGCDNVDQLILNLQDE